MCFTHTNAVETAVSSRAHVLVNDSCTDVTGVRLCAQNDNVLLLCISFAADRFSCRFRLHFGVLYVQQEITKFNITISTRSNLCLYVCVWHVLITWRLRHSTLRPVCTHCCFAAIVLRLLVNGIYYKNLLVWMCVALSMSSFTCATRERVLQGESSSVEQMKGTPQGWKYT